MPAGSFQHGRPRKTKKKEKKKKIESETRNSSAFQWTQFLSLRLLIGCLTGFLPFPHPDFQSKKLKKQNKKKHFDDVSSSLAGRIGRQSRIGQRVWTLVRHRR